MCQNPNRAVFVELQLNTFKLKRRESPRNSSVVFRNLIFYPFPDKPLIKDIKMLLWVWRESVCLCVIRKLFRGKPSPEIKRKNVIKSGAVFFSYFTYPSSLTHRHGGWLNCHSRSQLRILLLHESMEFQGCTFYKWSKTRVYCLELFAFDWV